MAVPEIPPASPRPPMGGGIFIAAGLVLGPLVGLFFGQVSAGLVAGGILGIIAAVLVAVKNR